MMITKDHSHATEIRRLAPKMSDQASERRLEAVAANLVHQIGDALYEALPSDVAHKYFVDARQATNDRAIDFAKKLISDHTGGNPVGNNSAAAVLTWPAADPEPQDGMSGTEE